MAEQPLKGETPITLEQLSRSADRRFDAVDRRFDAVDQRFDAVDQRFDAVDQRLDGVDEALVEQRQYTEFAFETLRQELKQEIGGVKSSLGRLERKMDRLIDREPPAAESAPRTPE